MRGGTGGRLMVMLAAATLLSGCAIMTGGQGAEPREATTPSAAGADNSGIGQVKTYVDDGLIATMIRLAYVRSERIRVANINVTVDRGRVLLTGSSSSKSEIDEAIRLAKGIQGVRNVTSELKVQHASVAELAGDALITSKVKVKLLADRTVRGLSIEVETTKGVVYLIGMVRSVAERDQAVELARRIGGVREVVSYIEVDESKPMAPVRSPMQQQNLAPVIQEGEGEIMPEGEATAPQPRDSMTRLPTMRESRRVQQTIQDPRLQDPVMEEPVNRHPVPQDPSFQQQTLPQDSTFQEPMSQDDLVPVDEAF